MKILKLYAENVKKLRVVSITPTGNIVQITGPNGSGKTSVLDAIYWALAGTKAVESQPVRQGEEKATIKLELGEITVTRRFTENGGTSLIVEAESGARFPSPQTMLDKLLGSLSFDPLAFSRMKPKEQLEQLRGMVKLDTDIDALDTENARLYAERTEVGRRAKSLNEQANALFVEMDPSVGLVPVNVDELLSAMESASQVNAEIEREKMERVRYAQETRLIREKAEAAQAEGERLIRFAEHERQLAESRDAGAKDLPAIAELVDTAVIRGLIEKARITNALIEKGQKYVEVRAAENEASATVTALTEAMLNNDKAKAEAVSRAQMPIPGLSFGAGEVIYNGLPFEQASSAEQLRISVAIAMAANPQLRVLRIKDGSLLDENSLRLIGEMVDAHDFQCWIEQVDSSGKVGIVMEDGAVKGADDAPAEAQNG